MKDNMNTEDAYEKGITKLGVKKEKETPVVESSVGYKIIPQDSTPSKWLFNDPSSSGRIRPLTWEEIKHYSLMDENDPISVNEKINEVLASCCKIGGNGDYRDLCFTDKLHFFFLIRDYTMMNNENAPKVYMTFTSSKNGEKKKVEITANVFEYFDIPKGMMKHYDEVNRCFSIDYGADEPMMIYVPKIGVIEKVREYIENIKSRKARGENVYLNKAFTVAVQYMVKDWRLIDDEFKYFEKLKEKFDGFTPEELQIFEQAKDLLKIGIKPTIKVSFDKGNVEVFPLVFRKYKSLFHVSSKVRTLFEVD